MPLVWGVESSRQAGDRCRWPLLVGNAMFEELRLLGSTEKSIVVQTRKGTPIDNLVEIEPGEAEGRRYRLLLEKYGRHWEERKPATGVYNCAGHVWASPAHLDSE